MEKEKNHIAILIDAENQSYRLIDTLMEKVKEYTQEKKGSKVTHKIAFGNWTDHGLSSEGWMNALRNNAIIQRHNPSYTKQKNASDIALVIYAIEAAFNKGLDTFILMSGDSDFTELVYKLVQYGKEVIICGTESTSESLKHAGHAFWLLESKKEEILTEEPNKIEKRKVLNSIQVEKLNVKIDKREEKINKKTIKELAEVCLKEYSNGEEFVDMSFLFNKMKEKEKELYNTYEVLNYSRLGFKKLKTFFEATKVFKFKKIEKPDTITYFVCLK